MPLETGLYLLPNLLDSSLTHRDVFPPLIAEIIPTLDGLIAENEKNGRQFLKRFDYPEGKSFRDIPISLLNEHSTQTEIKELLVPLKQGERWGLISDAGLPIFADPGSDLVFLCQKHHILIHPLPGPSSIVYALMLSGFSAQNFTFHGYLPRDILKLKAQLSSIEQRARSHYQTQLFIEAPYRNIKLFTALLHHLKPTTYLSIAWNLTLPSQGVITESIATWKKLPTPPLQKVPAVFLLALPQKRG